MVMLGKGDKRAFDEVYKRYSQPLFGYFMKLLARDNEKCEDMVHDLFAKIIRKPEYFDTSRSFRTWVYFSDRLQAQLEEMDEKHKSVFVLRHFDGFSMKEIAETLEINEGTVKSRLFYATKALASALKEFNPIYQ